MPRTRKKTSMRVKKKALTKRQDSAMKRHSKHHSTKHMKYMTKNKKI